MSEQEKPALNGTVATELETFLPKDNSQANGLTTYKIKGDDFEASNYDFDPFKARDLVHPVSNMDTLTHLLKASLGTGILSMPAAFKSAGLVMGIFSTIVVSLVCTHCSYILVVCAHELYKRAGKTQMSFAEVAEEACRRGPKWARSFAQPARLLVLIGIFVTYFFTCSCYTVIIAKNINYVLEYYMGHEINIRFLIATLLVPLILLAYVPNLKYLAPFSLVANVCMGLGLGITFYYLVVDIPSINDRPLIGDITGLPISVALTMFAIEAIGVVMPLENNMESPQSFTGLCGVLNQGMSFVTLVYILLGFFGFLRYGEATKDSITLNLPRHAIPAQIVNILIAVAVFCTFGLQFYVCLDIAWNGIKDYCTKHPNMSQYGVRTFMVIVCVAIAIAVPTIVPFVGLIGAFCFSIVGLLVPVGIEIITFWDKGFGPFKWKIIKDLIVTIIAALAFVFGSKSAIEDIIALY
ncbi:hypothetical protein ABEB36_001917 [Hypothenemus hampei]|uniref:Amino acid transporter transmembrane domain-containing protein n=1 Tax=Hypothenemus hampei TaxID=57062 RepID=A0ABD1FG49_HYPHA